MNKPSDAYIIEMVLAGNKSLFSRLIDLYGTMAFTIAYRILCNREDAEEAVQDAFLKAYENLGGFRQKSKFSTWLYRIVYNTAISHARKKRPAAYEIDDRTLQVPDTGAYEALVYGYTPDEAGELVRSMMSFLPEEDRIIVTLYYLNDSGVEEISSITGLSKTNIKVKLFRARKKMQECIGRIPDAVPLCSLNM